MIYRADTGRIQVTVAGIGLDGLSWDTMSAPSIAADNSYYHAGNMSPAMPVGGLRTPTDITITRGWSPTLYGSWIALYNAAGFTAMTATYTPLNLNSSATEKPTTFTGLLTTVTAPEYNADSAAIQYFTLILAPNESISRG